MQTCFDRLKQHDFFKDFNEADIKTISDCGRTEIFEPGTYLARENTPADVFYLIKKGRIQILLNVPNQPACVLQTIDDNEIFGWSWLFPPYEWMFDAKALQKTEVITLDGRCLRAKLEADQRLGYMISKRFAQLMIHRLNTTRLQLLNIHDT